MAAVNISLNGTERTVGAATLRQLLDELNAPVVGIAVAQNDEVVRREELDGARINDGDRIEIIRAVAGG
jgi:sulfur carrier protein